MAREAADPFREPLRLDSLMKRRTEEEHLRRERAGSSLEGMLQNAEKKPKALRGLPAQRVAPKRRAGLRWAVRCQLREPRRFQRSGLLSPFLERWGLFFKVRFHQKGSPAGSVDSV